MVHHTIDGGDCYENAGTFDTVLHTFRKTESRPLKETKLSL